jgi:hypothetical protein
MAVTEIYELLEPWEGRKGLPDPETARRILQAVKDHTAAEALQRERQRLGVDPNTVFVFEDVPRGPLAVEYRVSPSTAEVLARQQAHEHAHDQQRFEVTLRAAGQVAFGGWLPTES